MSWTSDRIQNFRFAPLVAWAVLLLAVPLVVSAQSAPTYQVVDWPSRQGLQSADYLGGADFTGVGVGHDGRVYITHGGKYPVMVYSQNGDYLGFFGRGLLKEPHCARIDPDGNLWVTDFQWHLVSKFSPNGQLLAQHGKKKHAGAGSKYFDGPTDVAFSANGDVYVSDGYGNSRVVRLNSNAEYVGQFGTGGKHAGEFRLPHSLAVDSQGNVYVCDRSNKRVQVFTEDGQFLDQWPISGLPFSIFISSNNLAYVTNGTTEQVEIRNLNGTLLSKFGKYGTRPGQFKEPHEVSVDQYGNLWVADGNGKRVQKFAPQ